MAKQVKDGELENAIMAALWSRPDGATAREVLDALPGPALAVTTVLTVLDRLQTKGMVTRTKEGRAHRYAATRTRAEFLSRLMSDALDSSDDRGAVLARFVGGMPATDTDLLRRLLTKRSD